MTLSEHVFLYCERGRSEAIFAEPFNAASNAAFLLAALAALGLLRRRPKVMRSADHMLLIAFVFLIGLGSLAFHLLADRASLLADVIPIDVFMLVYLGFDCCTCRRVGPCSL
jgi:MYXO-CTERM domain-containing protein